MAHASLSASQTVADTLSDRQSFNLNRYLINTYTHTHNSHRSSINRCRGTCANFIGIFKYVLLLCTRCVYAMLVASLQIALASLAIALPTLRRTFPFSPLPVSHSCLFVCLPACLPINLFVRLSLALCLETASMGGTFSFQLTVVTPLKRLQPHLAWQCCCAFRRGQALL